MAAMSKSIHKSSSHRVAIAACSFALTTQSEIQVLPAGEFHSIDGRPINAPCWLTNADIAARLIADINALANPLVIDYEHQTYLAADNGQPAPAAGWFKSLRWEEGVGLFACVEWTARATAHIEAGEYRFISPVITYNPTSGAVTKLLNAALTNNPAIEGMEAVSARLSAQLNSPETLTMDIEDLLDNLRYFFNLPTLASNDEVAAQLEKAVTLIKASDMADGIAMNTLGIVGLSQTRSNELVLLRAELTTHTTALTAAQAELTALKTASHAKQVTDLVTTALTAHKISPAQKDAMTELGMNNLALLTRVLESAVPIVAKGEVAPVVQGVMMDISDPVALSVAAQAYQSSEALAGRNINIAAAVQHVSSINQA